MEVSRDTANGESPEQADARKSTSFGDTKATKCLAELQDGLPNDMGKACRW
jgi:hypothetical protein